VLTIFEFDKDLKVAAQRQVDIPGFVFFHDFIVTENWYIFDQVVEFNIELLYPSLLSPSLLLCFLLNIHISFFKKAPVDFNPLPFLLGSKGPASCIDYTPTKPALLSLVPRDPSRAVQSVEVDAHFNFHFANAYDEGGKIYFDIVRCSKMTLGDTSKSSKPIWEEIDYAKEVPYSTLSRYVLSSENGKWGYSSKEISATQVDFTSVSPDVSAKKHRYIYASCGSDMDTSTPVQGVIKLDVSEGKEQKWFGEKYEFMVQSFLILNNLLAIYCRIVCR
jgi:all-trans-8'-apo-beta-carotenal 15,15'-oxygenase